MEVAEEAVKTETVEAKPAVSNELYDRSELPNLLRVYYAWLFPYDKYFQWLNYGITITSLCIYITSYYIRFTMHGTSSPCGFLPLSHGPDCGIP